MQSSRLQLDGATTFQQEEIPVIPDLDDLRSHVNIDRWRLCSLIVPSTALSKHDTFFKVTGTEGFGTITLVFPRVTQYPYCTQSQSDLLSVMLLSLGLQTLNLHPRKLKLFFARAEVLDPLSDTDLTNFCHLLNHIVFVTTCVVIVDY